MVEPIRAAFAKGDLRRSMRELRRTVPNRAQRSARIWLHVRDVPGVLHGGRILAYTTLGGEPDIGPFVEWCRRRGKDIAVPEDDVDPTWPDVVIVPGLAFTVRGDRLGQGGGWYDRFLAQARDDCTMIGVCFDPQIVGAFDVETHDVRLDCVVTESGPVSAP